MEKCFPKGSVIIQNKRGGGVIKTDEMQWAKYVHKCGALRQAASHPHTIKCLDILLHWMNPLLFPV